MMSKSSSENVPIVKEPRSNKLFQKRGLEKNILYQICLSTSRNPDFVVHHPNETKEKNPSGWKTDIEKRVRHEEKLRQEMLAMRLQKMTSHRRLNE